MDTSISAPLLSRVKSWQLVGLGISGWCTLYSVAIITSGAGNALIGNAQGGCFAATMTLAGCEARRFKRSTATPVDPLQWVTSVSTEQINQTITQSLKKNELRVEPCQPMEKELGFGVRAVNAGRTLVFETSRWKNPVIDLAHAQTTEENRKKVSAHQAVIVGAGTPDEDARMFAKTHPVNFLAGKELKQLLIKESGIDTDTDAA
jgi:hypothetical protein